MKTVNTAILTICTGLLVAALPARADQSAPGKPRADFPRREITVDGDLKDWSSIAPNVVKGRRHLWFGQGMTPEKWTGNDDLGYQWRGAWFGDHLYFLVEVTDDRLEIARQPYSYLCDCVEIYLDYHHQGGRRVRIADGRSDWFEKCDPGELAGYELHFLPSEPPRVYLDHTHKYAVDKPQTARFQRDWAGNVVYSRTSTGYLFEIGFRVPGVAMQPGKTLGVEIGVCDDDGNSRESIMMWTGTKSDFWITMEDYGVGWWSRGGLNP
jgi:hypothetical protein